MPGTPITTLPDARAQLTTAAVAPVAGPRARLPRRN